MHRSLSLPSQAASAAEARRFACDLVSDLGLQCEFGLTLVVSELVTNAVRYGEAPIELAIHVAPDRVRVEVTDASPVSPRMSLAPPEAVSGRGLSLIDTVAVCWGVEPCPGSGKVVWAEVDPSAITLLG